MTLFVGLNAALWPCVPLDGVLIASALAAYTLLVGLLALVLDLVVWRLAERGTKPIDYGVGAQTVDVFEPSAHPFRDVHVRRFLTGDSLRVSALLRGILRRDLRNLALLGAAFAATACLGVVGHRAPYCCCGSERDTARFQAALLRQVAYRERFAPASCPSPQRLVDIGQRDRTRSAFDPWGRPFLLDCSDDEIVVTSLGPDGKRGTEDDVRVPRD